MKLRSGNEIHANGDVFGIIDDWEGDTISPITGGLDNHIAGWVAPHWREFSDQEDRMTDEDAISIADQMIDRWSRFRTFLKTRKDGT